MKSCLGHTPDAESYIKGIEAAALYVAREGFALEALRLTSGALDVIESHGRLIKDPGGWYVVTPHGRVELIAEDYT